MKTRSPELMTQCPDLPLQELFHQEEPTTLLSMMLLQSLLLLPWIQSTVDRPWLELSRDKELTLRLSMMFQPRLFMILCTALWQEPSHLNALTLRSSTILSRMFMIQFRPFMILCTELWQEPSHLNALTLRSSTILFRPFMILCSALWHETCHLNALTLRLSMMFQPRLFMILCTALWQEPSHLNALTLLLSTILSRMFMIQFMAQDTLEALREPPPPPTDLMVLLPEPSTTSKPDVDSRVKFRSPHKP
jgi:hypothetical protein